jgi:hypothetical protein
MCPDQECFVLGMHHQAMHVLKTLQLLRRIRKSDSRLPWKAGNNECQQHTDYNYLDIFKVLD